jgi:hypothetical protein
VRVIQRDIGEHGLTQRQAAERMGLALCLNRLDVDIRIEVACGPRWKQRAGITVEVVEA